jgi:mannose-6-phosphate isomerase
MVDGRQRSLAGVIAEDPDRTLGAPVAERFGGQLPYLLKVLAIERPLSIQVHPSTSEAEEGYAREETAGVPLDVPERNYRDRSAKPEMLVALTAVRALAGFRPPTEAAAAMAELGADGLVAAVEALRTGGEVALETVARHWLRLPDAEASELASEVAKAAAGADGELATLVGELGLRYPGDRGILLALLLSEVRLAPGEAVFIGPGVPHAYLSGLAVEAQASSNNTLRAGLSGKHVDAGEVLRLLRYGSAPGKVGGTAHGDRVIRYDPGAAEFVLDRVTLGDPLQSDLRGPRIVLCTEGEASVTAGETVRLPSGGAAFCADADGPVTLAGEGMAFVVAPAQ